MSATLPESVDIARDDALAYALTWSFCAGKTYVTLAMKASFTFDSQGALELVQPKSILTRDVHQGGDPKRCLVWSVESAPYLTSGAVLLSGRAYPQKNAQKEPFLARVALSGRAVLVDKTIRIDDSAGEGVDLTYENAARDADNPFGGDRPKIFDPRNAAQSIGVGPLGPLSRTRIQYLKAPPPLFADVMDLGKEFDSRYWNPAPPDQQIPFLQGGETLHLEGFDAEVRRIRIELPRIGIQAHCEIAKGQRQPIPMSSDMLVVDTARRSLSIVWRSILVIPETTRVLAFDARLNGEVDKLKRKEAPKAAKPSQSEVSDPGRALVLKRIAEGAKLVDLDLTGADLRGLDLREQVLSGSKLDGAHLEEASLRGADLKRASLVRASLEEAMCDEANFEGADLSGTKLGGASFKRAELVDTNLSGATGEGAIFDGARLMRARFVSADLPRARFEGAHLEEADFTKASIKGARFKGASLERANLTQTHAEKASFIDARLIEANLGRASLIEARLDGADASRAIFDGACGVKASFLRTQLVKASFEKASLDEARLDEANLSGANLSQCAGPLARLAGSNLSGASLRQSHFDGAAFSNADLTKADLSRADLGKALFDDANLTEIDARGARMAHAKLNRANVMRADFRDADLSSATLSGVDRSTARFEGAKLTNVVE